MGAHYIRRVQDSVHGLMEFRGMEALTIDVLRTPELQRLRKIRQLGLAHYVFPGAEHSRLSHSLGTAHLALRFGHQLAIDARRFFVPTLVPDESALADLALAALCHDLGHGPLSHVWEREVVGENFDSTKWAKALGLNPSDPLIQKRKWHELVGQGLLAWEEGLLYKLLESHEVGTCLRLRHLLGGQYYLYYLPRILSSDVDVDRADYIMRDTHQTGVAYGRFDLNWLLSTCCLGSVGGSGGECVVGFDSRKAVRVIEQFLIARRALYETVYQHKTVRCIEGMVGHLLRRLKDIIGMGHVPIVSELARPMVAIMQGEALGPRDILKLDDFALSVLIDSVAGGAVKDDTCFDLAQRIQSRNLFKIVPVPSEVVAEFVREPDRRAQLYEIIKPYVPGPSKYYVIFDRIKFDMFNKNEQDKVMLVDMDSEARLARPATEHPSLLVHRSSSPDEWRVFTVRQAVDEVRRFLER